MMLKKQTVWLLTMLSLVIVLSVYYITTPDPKNDLSKGSENGQEESNQAGTEKNSGKVTEITQVTGDEAFEAIRLQIQDERSKRMEELQTIAASTDLPAEERSAAKDEMDQLSQIAEKEKLLESLIVSTLGYEDALVRVNGTEVRITVKGHEPTKTNANEIIRMVEKEIGTTQITVAFQEESNESK